MRNGRFLVIAGLAILIGCGNMETTPAGNTAAPKWKPTYHLAFATQTPKPNPAGVTLPSIGYTLSSKDWERRAALVVRLDAPAKNAQPGKDRLILDPVDIPGTGGNLPDKYMDMADKQLAKLLADRCMKGTVKLRVAIVRSSIRPVADDAEINSKLLSDWLPTEVVFKNPHPKC